jgi:hypothetical protein
LCVNTFNSWFCEKLSWGKIRKQMTNILIVPNAFTYEI